MIYEWKTPGLFPVSAEAAANELTRIYDEKGELRAEDVVEESRPLSAPLHNCFEWDDEKAAEKYRKQQAETIIRCVVVREEHEESAAPVGVRALVHAQGAYHPINVVVNRVDMMDELLRTALREAEVYRNKYEMLLELKPIFNAIDDVKEKLDQLSA